MPSISDTIYTGRARRLIGIRARGSSGRGDEMESPGIGRMHIKLVHTFFLRFSFISIYSLNVSLVEVALYLFSKREMGAEKPSHMFVQ